jgi:hypothetical protein
MSRIFTAAGALVDRIKINAISREVRSGRPVWIKRRRPIARPLMMCANRFFDLARTPVRAITDLAVWQRWEVGCFCQLHESEGFHAFCDGDAAVGADEMPGVNLTRHLDGGTITARMTAAAARELRRAHGSSSELFGGNWSHGDPHLGNFIYDESADRARLIDFEMMHDRTLSADERHTDDLLVFLQDMVGRICAERWLPCARAFLQAYDRPEILARLEPKLELPEHRIPRLWWLVRTTFLPAAESRRRIADLRQALA